MELYFWVILNRIGIERVKNLFTIITLWAGGLSHPPIGCCHELSASSVAEIEISPSHCYDIVFNREDMYLDTIFSQFNICGFHYMSRGRANVCTQNYSRPSWSVFLNLEIFCLSIIIFPHTVSGALFSQVSQLPPPLLSIEWLLFYFYTPDLHTFPFPPIFPLFSQTFQSQSFLFTHYERLFVCLVFAEV